MVLRPMTVLLWPTLLIELMAVTMSTMSVAPVMLMALLMRVMPTMLMTRMALRIHDASGTANDASIDGATDDATDTVKE